MNSPVEREDEDAEQCDFSSSTIISHSFIRLSWNSEDFPEHAGAFARQRSLFGLRQHSEIYHIQHVPCRIEARGDGSFEAMAAHFRGRTALMAAVHRKFFNEPVIDV